MTDTAPAAPGTELIARIDALLPQTQCTRCGYEGCQPYAAAVAAGAPINRCPPGGTEGIAALAHLLGRPLLPLDPECGQEGDSGVAWIDPEACIGCARCLPPCPVDAIIGAQRQLHTVWEAACTGCELCLASCPVDCIHMQPRSPRGPAPSPTENRVRYLQHQGRAQRAAEDRATLLSERKKSALAKPDSTP